MARTASRMVAAAVVVAAMMLFVMRHVVEASHASFQIIPVAFHRPALSKHCALQILRGGDAADVLEEEEESEDEYDFEEESEELEELEEDEEEEEEDEVLVKSAVKATRKAQAKKTADGKKVVSSAMSKKKKKSILRILRIPYIIRASLNPFTLATMTKAYFASLFNLNYLQEDSSQNLRSALEEKAKKEGGAGGKKKGKRTMRPGQAKTLSDLPQLST